MNHLNRSFKMLIVVILTTKSHQSHISMVKDLNSQKCSYPLAFSAQSLSTDLKQVLTIFLKSFKTERTTQIQALQEQIWFIGMEIMSPLLPLLRLQILLIQELTCSKIGLNSFQTLPICFTPMDQSVSTKSTKVEWEIVTGWHHLQL